ncbi:restriction endonuclease-like protein [Salinibacter ruber]|uniref:DUF2357 domain-containing protein n=1 Tax=Salinibacter ruber TaxID=146919 RepID=A0A9X2UB91_9BACT|nr:restriction endonuclease-like protein [Salinibacter ruber]MCS3953371.1 hypothetical protein [Salinibacter ruber]
MKESVLTIRPRLRPKKYGSNWSQQRIDLSTRRGRRYIFPEPLSEYERYNVILNIESDGPPLRVRKIGDDKIYEIRKINETKIKYERELSKEARQGVAKDRIHITIGSTTYRLSILLPLKGEDLNRQQYDLMLEDISHWLHTSLHRRTEHELAPETQDSTDKSLKADLETFYRVRRHVNHLKDILKRINSAPEEEIRKVYKQTRSDSPREDSRTLRWNEVRSGVPESLTYDSTRTFDVYENRFILFLLHRLDQLLLTVENSAEKTEEKLADTLRKTERLYNQGGRDKSQVNDARKDHQKSQEILDEISNLRDQIRRMERYPFLREVSYDPSQFQISFSLTLTQDINYSQVFSVYRNLRQDSRLRRLGEISQFVERISSLGVQRTWQVYEYWTFFATYRTLLELGFSEDTEDGIIGVIDQETLTPGLKSGECVTLRYDPDDGESHQDMGESALSGLNLRLCYEKSFWNGRSKQGNPAARPDMTVEVYHGRYLVGRFILDAKYKTKEVSENGSFRGAKKQAQRHQAKEASGVVEEGMGAFFLHIDADEKDFDYVRCTEGDKRWSGHIPVLPGDINDLKVLLERDFLGQRIPQFLR